MEKITMDILADILDCAAGITTVVGDCMCSLLAGYNPTATEIAAIHATRAAVANAYDTINGATQDFQAWAWDNAARNTLSNTMQAAMDITSVVGFAGRAIQYCADTVSLPFSAADKIPADITIAIVLAKQLNDITIHWPGTN